MKTSYSDYYKHFFTEIVNKLQPTQIVEFGILNGFSLHQFAISAPKSCSIIAYDIFDQFTGNQANKQKLLSQFKQYENVFIQYGNFYTQYKNIPDNTIDILHVDIANDGLTYETLFKHYMQKIKDNGIVLIEGGEKYRDEIEWMIKYNKPKILPVIEKYKKIYDIKTIFHYPSLTIIRKLSSNSKL